MTKTAPQFTAETHVIKFSLTKVSAQIHVKGCNALNIQPRQNVVTPWDQAEVDDLNERGYKVKVCKCCESK